MPALKWPALTSALILLTTSGAAAAQNVGFPGFNPSIILDTLLLLLPGYLAVQLFRALAIKVITNHWRDKGKSVKGLQNAPLPDLNIANFGVLLFAVALSLVGLVLANTILEAYAPDLLITYFDQSPSLTWATFLSLLIHVTASVILAPALIWFYALAQRIFQFIPDPELTPWEATWLIHFDPQRHIAQITFKDAEKYAYGTVEQVITRGRDQSILLKDATVLSDGEEHRVTTLYIPESQIGHLELWEITAVEELAPDVPEQPSDTETVAAEHNSVDKTYNDPKREEE